MYNLIPYFLAAALFLLGLFMAVKPKSSVKPEMQNDEAAVEKARRNGIILVVLSAVLVLFQIVRLMLFS